MKSLTKSRILFAISASMLFAQTLHASFSCFQLSLLPKILPVQERVTWYARQKPGPDQLEETLYSAGHAKDIEAVKVLVAHGLDISNCKIAIGSF